MSEQYFLYLCLAALVGQLAGRSAAAIGASVYDVRAAHKLKKYTPAVTARRKKQAITVFVLAYNNQRNIEYCLESLALVRSAKLEVVVIDNVSTDATREVVAAYNARNPKQQIRLLRKRKQQPAEAAYRSAAGYTSGQLAVCITGAMVLDDRAVEQICVQFAEDKTLQIVQLALQSLPYPSFFTVLQQIEYLHAVQLNKTRALLRVTNNIPHEAPLAMRAAAFRKGLGALPDAAIRYSARAVVYAQPETSAQRFIQEQYQAYTQESRFDRRRGVWANALVLVQKLENVLKVLEPFMLTYFFYLALTHKNGTLVLLSFFLSVLWLLQLVWTEAGKQQAKLELTLATPLIYLLLYVKAVSLLVFATLYVLFCDAKRPFVWAFRQVRLLVKPGAAELS